MFFAIKQKAEWHKDCSDVARFQIVSARENEGNCLWSKMMIAVVENRKGEVPKVWPECANDVTVTRAFA